MLILRHVCWGVFCDMLGCVVSCAMDREAREVHARRVDWSTGPAWYQAVIYDELHRTEGERHLRALAGRLHERQC